MMAEDSLLGSAIVAVLGLAAMLWLPRRIVGVWRGGESAPWLPIRRTDRVLGYTVFTVTARNFPAFGAALLCMGGFAFCLGASNLVGLLGLSGLEQPIVLLGVSLLPVAFAFGFIAALIDWTGSPTFLVPPALRERENEPATGSEGGTTPETSPSTEECEEANRNDGLLDPDGLLDKVLAVAVAIVAGFVAGLIVLLIATEVSASVGLVAGFLAWLGAGVYIGRSRTVQGALSKAAYAIAVAIMSISLLVFSPEWESGFASNLITELAIVTAICAVPAAVVTGLGMFAGRYVPESSPDG